MSSKRTLRRVTVAALLLVAFLFQGTWALAGVTGNLTGYVHDAVGAPVAGATVQITSPSQVASTTTDAKGRFLFLSLAPDTYTISVSKDGYQTSSFPGNTVFADQTQQVSVSLPKALKTIAHVTAQAAGALVKSGVGGDIYSVNSTQAAAAAPLGGGGNLNNAYSAMASVPGVLANVGGMGWNSNFAFIRGQNSYYTGFEYDGIPVNRAFDNYNSSTESTLGLQELQVYTGGGPASIATSGTSGFINQVIKTGTYPGYANLSGSVGTPTYYHQATVEAGGSTPDRNFSYYVGISGFNQWYRLFDNNNGASLMTPGQIYPYYLGGGPQGLGVTAICNDTTGVPPAVFNTMPWGNGGCFYPLSGLAAEQTASNVDRENVINLHFGIQRKDGLRDDIQALWSGSALWATYYDTPSQIGVNAWTLLNTGAPYCPNQSGCTYGVYGTPTKFGYNPGAPWLDSIVYDKPFGTAIARSQSDITPPSPYFFPSSPTDRQLYSAYPANQGGGNENDTGIVKLQYTHALSSSAYLRMYAYSFYSDWMENDPSYFFLAADYELDTHTTGGGLQFQDQISDKNLLTLSGNYTTASVMRFNNGTIGTSSPIGYFSGSGNSMACYNPAASSGPQSVPCIPTSYWDTGASKLLSPTWTSSAAEGPTGFGGPAGTTWNTLWDGGVTGSLNTVDPRFTSLSLEDQFRPSDRFMIDGAMRYDNYGYVLPNSSSAATDYYAGVMANYTCYSMVTHQLLQEPLLPGLNENPPAPPLYVNGDCNTAVDQSERTTGATGWVHPNGTTQDGYHAPNFTATSPGSYSLDYWSPRISGTYTQSPDTVWRASAGRYVQPPLSASVQYLAAGGNELSVWAQSMNLGYFSPFHAVPGISSGQYDLSLERHIRGTDWSFKITPFFSDVSNWQTQIFIGAGFVTQIPYGQAQNAGAEFELDKGDFNRNGLSGKLAITYTNAIVQFEGLGGAPNQIDVLNTAVNNFNALTKAGGGYPCYTHANGNTGAFGIGSTNCGPNSGHILNPYYHMAPQPLENAAGWYPAPAIGIGPSLNYNPEFYQSPWVTSLILNYRHDALAITPSLQFLTGSRYGEPMDIVGIDPRTCANNSVSNNYPKNGVPGGVIPGAGAAFPATQCNYASMLAPGATSYGYLYIPNPQTGTFANFGQYTQPSILVGNIAATYDVNRRVRIQATVTNLFHTCFGGSSEAWTTAYPPGGNICGYGAEGNNFSNLYVSNFYNGKSPNDKAANGITPYNWQLQSYGPAPGNESPSVFLPPPLNVYLGVQIKL